MEIPSYFRRYLSAIQPSLDNRQRAAQLHSTLRTRLAGDKYFQDWYDSTFLYGSYKRNTAVMPIKDVDVCVVLTIKTKDHKPEAVVDRLRRVLERNHYDGKTSLQRRSVRIDLSGATLDVVPVVAENGPDNPFLIPDRTLTKWVETHPKEHLAVATQLNTDSNKRYIPFVKIVKAWHRFQRDGVERPKPKGFTLEALVAAYGDKDAPTYAEAFINFLDNLWRDCGASLKNGVFPSVPDPGLPNVSIALNVDADEAKLFGTIVKASLDQAMAARELDTTIRESAEAWRAILGSRFPVEPESVKFAESATEIAGEDLDDEIADVDLPSPQQLGRIDLKVGLAMKKYGPIYQSNYPSGSRPLGQDVWLRFSIAGTTVRQPYGIRWIVENHGAEAAARGDLRPRLDGTEDVQWEHTEYRGSHTMICELRNNGILLARRKHVVLVRK